MNNSNSSEQLAIQILSVAIAQIAAHPDFGGFSSLEGHAFSNLVAVIGKFIECIGKQIRTLTDHAGRTESNIVDVLQAFQMLQPVSVDWRQLDRMCKECKVVPLSGIPRFPIRKNNSSSEYGKDDSENGSPLPQYLPSHFPRFPEPHCYKNTAVSAVAREENPAVIIENHLQSSREAKMALAKLSDNSGGATQNEFGKLSNSDSGQNLSSTKPIPQFFK